MRLRISTDDVQEHQRTSFWHDGCCKQIFHVTPGMPLDPSGFSASVDMQIAGRFALADVQATHGNIEKTQNDIARDTSDNVLLYVASSANQRYEIGRQEINMCQGDVCIVPLDRPYKGTADDIGSRSLMIPASILRPLMTVPQLQRAQWLPAAHPLGALLRDSLESAAVHLPRLTDNEGDVVLTQLSNLAAMAFSLSEQGQQTGQEALHTARLDALKRHIMKNLTDAALSPTLAAVALKMSVRQIHLVFLPFGCTFS